MLESAKKFLFLATLPVSMLRIFWFRSLSTCM